MSESASVTTMQRGTTFVKPVEILRFCGLRLSVTSPWAVEQSTSDAISDLPGVVGCRPTLVSGCARYPSRPKPRRGIDSRFGSCPFGSERIEPSPSFIEQSLFDACTTDVLGLPLVEIPSQVARSLVIRCILSRVRLSVLALAVPTRHFCRLKAEVSSYQASTSLVASFSSPLTPGGPGCRPGYQPRLNLASHDRPSPSPHLSNSSSRSHLAPPC
mmetsp:Transcript_28141/g.68383  ORF Transcript_28141/g.68383 Transcript_28141/m.68383 type:complete len:215 (+) Transcript_28141:709-1353(+)